MTDSTSVQRRRHWSDVAAIVAGVAAIGLAIWPALPSDEGAIGVGVGSSAIASAVAGILAIAGVVLAQRSPGVARIPLIVGGLLLVATPFLFVGTVGLVPSLQVVLGVVMLLASPFLGRMPDVIPERPDGRRL